MQQDYEQKWREYFGAEKWLNIKEHDALKLAGVNVTTEKAAVEKDEAEAEAANEIHADSSAESKAAAEKDEAGAEAAKKRHGDSSAESNTVIITGCKGDSSPGSNARPTKDNSTKEESPLCTLFDRETLAPLCTLLDRVTPTPQCT